MVIFGSYFDPFQTRSENLRPSSRLEYPLLYQEVFRHVIQKSNHRYKNSTISHIYVIFQ